MTDLLNFLIRFCSHLFETPGFRFKDAAVGQNSAEGSYILMESDDLQIYVSNEREQITLQIRSVHDPKSKNWFSFDLIARLLGQKVPTGLMDATNCELLSKNIDTIIGCFERKKLNETLTKLDEFKNERAKCL